MFSGSFGRLEIFSFINSTKEGIPIVVDFKSVEWQRPDVNRNGVPHFNSLILDASLKSISTILGIYRLILSLNCLVVCLET